VLLPCISVDLVVWSWDDSAAVRLSWNTADESRHFSTASRTRQKTEPTARKLVACRLLKKLVQGHPESPSEDRSNGRTSRHIDAQIDEGTD